MRLATSSGFVTDSAMYPFLRRSTARCADVIVLLSEVFGCKVALAMNDRFL